MAVQPIRGMCYEVFTDPITKRNKEGTATVLEVLHGDEEMGYYCRVRFPKSVCGDTKPHYRWINQEENPIEV